MTTAQLLHSVFEKYATQPGASAGPKPPAAPAASAGGGGLNAGGLNKGLGAGPAPAGGLSKPLKPVTAQPAMQPAARPLPPTYERWPDGGPKPHHIQQLIADGKELGAREGEITQRKQNIVNMMNNFDPLGERTPAGQQSWTAPNAAEFTTLTPQQAAAGQRFVPQSYVDNGAGGMTTVPDYDAAQQNLNLTGSSGLTGAQEDTFQAGQTAAAPTAQPAPAAAPVPAPAQSDAPGTGTTTDPNLQQLAGYTKSLARPSDAPIPETGEVERGAVIDMTKPLDVNAVAGHFNNPNLKPEQKTQLATDLATKLKNENPQYYEGFQDIQAGRTDTEAAKAYQGRLQQAQDEFVQQQVQADPQKAATPQGFGEIVNGAMSTFQNMHPAMQAMVGIGLPVGLIGIMSSMFGEGGMGMGILGALGLGAGVLGGAAGGMFGQGASNMVGDAMYNMGTFLGMAPEKADLSALKGNDPVGQIVNQSGRIGSREEVAKKIEDSQKQVGQLRQLMSLPVGDDVKIRLMQRLDPSIDSMEAGQQALQNAGTLLQAYDDPKSELQKKLQQGQAYANDKGTWRGWGTEQLAGWSDWWNGHGGLGAGQQQEKGSADMNINKLIEKWAFNDMDAKELSDLKAEKAKGAPYRVDDARREHALNLRNQAEAPAEKTQLVATCMKSARCWAGYEPVPGKKPYSEDSCRPVGSKKKKKSPSEKK